MELRYPSSLQRVVLLERSPTYRMAVTAVMVGVYALIAYWMVSTIGEPYEMVVEEIRRRRRDNPGIDESETEPQLPSPYLPSAFAVATGMFSLCLHFLSYMLSYWMVTFDAANNYKPSKRVRPGAFLMFQPQKNRGKAAIVPIVLNEATGKLTATYSRLLYEIDEEGQEKPFDDLQGPAGAPIVRMLKCPDDWTLAQYCAHRGLDPDEVTRAKATYGENTFTIPIPSYLQLFKEQVLSPLAMFQIFCSCLWCLDTYWKYTLTQMCTILGFDAMTALQRKKTLSTLRGMATESYEVYVYREGAWNAMSSHDICPGDLVSIKMVMPAEDEENHTPPLVPCDAVIVRGSAVVNEASLTGESVPQMKDAISKDEVQLGDRHKAALLYSGTTLVSSNAGAEDGGVPPTPDGGVLCVALRTGFFSAQGELMRMIEMSQDKVSGDVKETLLALLILLFFAICSAGYVMKKGLEDNDRSRYDLLLRCVMIITSVVPPSLPLQMAFAVNQALISLARKKVFCTEPWRVPLAGAVNVALFDKTGTLTTDSLLPLGVLVNEPQLKPEAKVLVGADRQPGRLLRKSGAEWEVQLERGGRGNFSPADVALRSLQDQITPVAEVQKGAAHVLAGCHSIMEVKDELIGDPVELTAFEGLEYTWEASTQTAVRGLGTAIKKKIATAQKELADLAKSERKANAAGGNLTPFQLEERARFTQMEADETERLKKNSALPRISVHIQQRFHFDSALQRMSTVAEVCDGATKRMALVKGSPEVIKTLCTSVPKWYDSAYIALAEEGIRVLALASRPLGNERIGTRAQIEKDLTFHGFVAFRCLLRSDSALVVDALNSTCIQTIMLTGDAALTAAHVAEEVRLCKPGRPMLQLTVEGEKAVWKAARRGDAAPPATDRIDELVRTHELLSTEKAWEVLISHDPSAWAHCEHVKVWARMSPQGKATLIRELNQQGKGTLMCGDGGNDVGALKQASVGIALLSGFGNTNTKNEAIVEQYPDDPELALERLEEQITERAKQYGKKMKAKTTAKTQEVANDSRDAFMEMMQKKQEDGGDVGFMSQMKSFYGVMMKQRNDMVSDQRKKQNKHGSAVAANAAQYANIVDGLDNADDTGMTPMVRLGDASIAAPFTYWTPSIACVLTIVRQGRCTVLSTLQQSQIMMLECIVNAYSLAALSLHGVRSSERQLMATGMLMTVASLSFSYATPINRIHKVKPHRSLFHPAIFFSTMLQVAIHLSCMVYAVKLAEETMGETELKAVTRFFKKLKQEGPPEDLDLSDDPWAFLEWLKTAPYKPSLLNTTTFLVGSAQEIAVLLVNYKGQPWMKGATQNHALCLTLGSLVIGLTILSWNMYPQLNEMLELAPFPDDAFRYKVMTLVSLSLVGSFAADRLVLAIFSYDIFYAQFEQFLLIRLSDVMAPLMTLGKIVGVLWVLGSGNLLIAGLLYWQYRRYNSGQAAK